MTDARFIPKSYSNTPEAGSVTWQSPSNIALVKYWGKHGEQLPMNPSISFTLDACHTVTTLEYEKKSEPGYAFEVFLDGTPVSDFAPKIATFFDRVVTYLPFLDTYRFVIRTSNSFPHSSGIASSASGMSALALCLMSLEREMMEEEMAASEFLLKASFLARLGSGSACRSIEGPLVVWGRNEAVTASDDLFGVRYEHNVHPNFRDYQDTILIVEKGEKQVSSTVGHGLMEGHPFAENRFRQANEHLEKLVSVLDLGDYGSFIDIVEKEALSLHAMMMTSSPYFMLMKPNTLEIINRVWAYRKETGSHLCFTLDAGANVHLLYPHNEKDSVLQFIKNELVGFCQNGQYICDQIGLGAKKL